MRFCLVPESATVPPAVKPMANVTVREGQPARFSTQVSGTPTPTVQWFREGIQIPQSTDFQVGFTLRIQQLKPLSQL